MSNETKQTAVDLMFQRAMFILPQFSIDARRALKETYQQAKEMEKEQIIKACDSGFDTANLFIEDMKYNSAEEYYNKTYGGNK